MITKPNQTNLYINTATRDAIRVVREGESAVLYYPHDVKQLIKAFGRENLSIYAIKANHNCLSYEVDAYFISYKQEKLLAMIYAKKKLAFFKDAGIHIAKEEKQTLMNLTTKPQIETFFWTLYDKYTADYI